jgi:SRSO17 transposase
MEWPTDAEAPTTYWLASLPDESLGLRRLVRLAKGRWRIEQDYRELKDELGLDHFEGRSWTRLASSRHARLDGIRVPGAVNTPQQKKRRA